MAVQPITFEGTDASRMPSPSIWGRCPWRAIEDGLTPGAVFFDDFMSIPKTPPTTEGNWGQYAAFTSTGGGIANDTTELGGAAKFSSDDDAEGASIRTLITPFKIIQTGKRFWMEARILTLNITDTTVTCFLGLMEDAALTASVPLINSSPTALADKNLLGFFRTETALKGANMNSVYKVDGVTAVTVQSDIVTMVAATYFKLGMKYEPSGDKAGNYALSFYVNGARCTTSKLIPSAAGTDFPNDISLGPVFAVLNAAGTSPGSMSMDWWKFAQEY